MNNFVSMLIAVMAHLQLLTKDEAERLSKELHAITIPDSYEGVHALVDEAFKKAKVTVKKDVSTLEGLVKNKVTTAENEVKKIVDSKK